MDPSIIAAWLAAWSIGRGHPSPVPDRGGLRVDTNTEKELRRWVFHSRVMGLSEVASETTQPRHFLKLCGNENELAGLIPSRWQIQPTHHVMTAGSCVPDTRSVADGYSIENTSTGATTCVRILTSDGNVAASGYATETREVFIYDRIETVPAHQRRGLGRMMMAALGAVRKSPSVPQILVATEEGRRLYASLGWTVLSALSTAVILSAAESAAQVARNGPEVSA